MTTSPHKKTTDSALRLGDAIASYLEGDITRRHRKFGTLKELLPRLIPAELRSACSVDSVSAGKVRIRVDDPSKLYRLQLLHDDILTQARRRCPAARIAAIKFFIAPVQKPGRTPQ